jgi:signal peptidase I
MIDPPAAAPARVCPTCGQPAGADVFCAHCGANLSKVDALPTREEWLAGQRSGAGGRRGRPIALIIGYAAAALVVVGLGVLYVAGHSATAGFKNVSASMEPTWNEGDHLVVNTDVYRSQAPEIGDVIVFHPPAGADQNVCADAGKQQAEACAKPTAALGSVTFVKRVVAGPGDELSIKAGHVYVDGKRQPDPAIVPCGADGVGCDFPSSIIIPPDHWFTMGDNRGESDDSRFWGPVPTAAILGRVDSCAPFHLFCHAKG